MPTVHLFKKKPKDDNSVKDLTIESTTVVKTVVGDSHLSSNLHDSPLVPSSKAVSAQNTQTSLTNDTIDAKSECWTKAEDILRQQLSSGKKAINVKDIDDFLYSRSRQSDKVPVAKTAFDKTIQVCESLQKRADTQYHTKDGRSSFAAKLMNTLMTVKEVGDPFLQFAPQSASIVWWAVTSCVQVAIKDMEKCELVSTASNSLVTIVLNCRMFEKRYMSRPEGSGDADTESRIMEKIPEVIAGVLGFAWYTEREFFSDKDNKLERMFKHGFSSTLKSLVDGIYDKYKELRVDTSNAFETRVMDQLEAVYKSHGRQVQDVREMLFPKLDGEDIRIPKFSFTNYEWHESEMQGKIQDIIDKMEKKADDEAVRNRFKAKREYFNPDEHHIQHFENHRTIFRSDFHYKEIAAWFFESVEYKAWQKVGSPNGPCILCVCAERGFGKSSILTSTILRLQELEEQSEGKIQPIILYFYFKKGDTATELATRALESVVSQLLDDQQVFKDTSTMKAAIKIIEELKSETNQFSTSSSQGPDVEDSKSTISSDLDATALKSLNSPAMLRSIIENIGKELKRPIYIVLDAIDECESSSAGFDIIHLMTEMAHTEECTIRIITSSRDEDLLKRKDIEYSDDGMSETEHAGPFFVDSHSGITIVRIDEKTNSEDMNRFLRKQLSELIRKRMRDSPSEAFEAELSSIVKIVKTKAKGSFLYARMVCSSLSQPYRLTMRQMLRNLPDGIGALYKKSLEALTYEERSLITTALTRTAWSINGNNISAIEVAEQFKQVYAYTQIDENEDAIAVNDTTEDDNEKSPPVNEVHTELTIKKYDANNDPEIIDIVAHLKRAGREFLKVGENNSIIVEPTVIDWVKKEALEASGWQADDRPILMTDFFAKDPNGGWRLSLPIPAIVGSDRGTADFQSEKDAQLDITINIMETLNHPLFWARYMPCNTESDNNDKQKTTEPDNNNGHRDDVLNNLPENVDQKEEDQSLEDHQASEAFAYKDENKGRGTQLVCFESENVKSDDRNDQCETSLKHNVLHTNEIFDDQQTILEETNHWSEPEIEYDEHQAESLDSVDKIEEIENNNEDPMDYNHNDIEDNEYESKEGIRYEIKWWCHHLKKLENLWAPKDRHGPKWNKLWESIKTFLTGPGLLRWKFTLNSKSETKRENSIEKGYNELKYPPILIIAEHGILMVAEKLIMEIGHNPNVVDQKGRNPLFLAAKHPNMVKYLIDKGVDIDATSKMGQTPLLYALDKCYKSLQKNGPNDDIQAYEETARILISNGADINRKDESDWTSLSFAAVLKMPSLFGLITKHATQKIDIDMVNTDGKNILQLVLYQYSGTEHIFGLVRACINLGINLNSQDKQRYTALSHCLEWLVWTTSHFPHPQTASIYLETAKLLLKNGSNPNLPDVDGWIALSSAVSASNEEIFDLCMEHEQFKPEVNHANNSGETPLHLLFQNPAARPEVVVRMCSALIKAGADVNAQDSFSLAPLASAAYAGNTEVVKLLLDNNADPMDDDNWGLTALHQACASLNDNDEIVQILLDHGIDCECLTKIKRGPLWYAIAAGRVSEVKILLGAYRQRQQNGLPRALEVWLQVEDIETGKPQMNKDITKYTKFGDTKDIFNQGVNTRQTNDESVSDLNQHPIMRKDTSGQNLMHKLADPIESQRQAEIARLLLEEASTVQVKILLEAENEAGLTPLHIAASKKDEAMVRLLLESGANPLLKSMQTSLSPIDNTSVIWRHATYQLDSETQAKQLDTTPDSDERQKIKPFDEMETCLLLMLEGQKLEDLDHIQLMQTAACKNSYRLLARLAELGAQPDAVDEHGWSACHMAKANGTMAALQIYFPNHDIEADAKKTTIKVPTNFIAPTSQAVQVEDIEKVVFTTDSSEDSCLVITDHPLPLENPIYFEVTILESSVEYPEIAIGLVSTIFRVASFLGFSQGLDSSCASYGYHADEGKIYEPDYFSGKIYNPHKGGPFGVGTTIGCGLNRAKQEIYYSKNGKYLGPAFKGEGIKGKLFPAISIKGTVTKMKTNFGEEPFLFTQKS